MNKYLILFSFFLLSSEFSQGQINSGNGPDRRIEFAQYLFNTQQYEFAAQEYLKLAYDFPLDAALKKRALESFRMAGDIDDGNHFSFEFFKPEEPGLSIYYPEIVKLRLVARKPVLIRGLEIDSLQFRNFYNESLMLDYMMSEQWDKVVANRYRVKSTGLYRFTELTPADQYLSPFLAGALSTVVPGTGKIYAKRWRDGLSSLLFVGLTAYQSYRGFERNGVESVYGWIMGGFSFGFYLGNIYGSVKAVRDHNTKLDEDYKRNIIDYYIQHY